MKKNQVHPCTFHKVMTKILLRMKILAVFMLISIATVSAKSYSQQTKLSFSLNQVTVAQVFSEIEKNSEFILLYNEKTLDLNRTVSLNVDNEGIENILMQLFADTKNNFKIYDRQIVILEADGSVPTGIVTDGSQPQRKEIKGKITDENKMPLPGVSIVLKGTTIGITTDINGEFSLRVPLDARTLVVSFVGMQTQEADISQKSMVNLSLAAVSVGVSDVVVTALGLKREKKALGYSVGEVKGELLTETPQVNVLTSLQGKVPGVRISQMNGNVGSSVNIIIRGAKSLNNDNQPLFVIDGVPVSNASNNIYNGADMGNAISDLNPDDVESISVLKGASAAALYGSRAGNGVILITTRSGVKGKKGIGVAVNSSIVFDVMTDVYPYQTRFASGKAGAHILEQAENESWGSQLDVGEKWVLWNSKGVAVPLVSNKNRIQDFMRTGYTLTNNVAVDGNNKNGYFRLSLGDMRNTGMIPNTDLKRSTINLNAQYKLSDKLSVTANFNWNETGSANRPNVTGDDRNDVVRSLYEKGAQVNINDLKSYWVPGLEGIQQLVNASKQNNAYFVANENTNSFTRDRLISKVQFDWDITMDLSLMGRFSRDAYTENREGKRAFSTTTNTTGYYNVYDFYNKENNIELNLSYKKKINKQWNVNGFLAANQRYVYGRAISNTAASLVIPQLYTISNGVPGTISYSSSWYKKAVYSIYGMASIDYKGMAYLDLTGRNDWSSTLPKANRSYFYPSASLSLLFSEMFTMPAWVNYAKLRAGSAQLGNDTGPYNLDPSFSIGADWGSSKQMFMGGNLTNNTLKPERSISNEVGVDLKFLKSRVGLEATYYVVQNKNQILNISLPIESGASSKSINSGNIESRGWEINLTTSPVVLKDFRWDLNFSFTKNKTRLKELAEGLTNINFYSIEGGNGVIRTKVGEWMGDIWEKPVLKVTDKASPYYGYPIIASSGKYQMDQDPSHMIKIGNTNQDFILGMQPTFTYKSFSLYANIEWNQGGQFYSNSWMFMQNNGVNASSFSGAPYDKGKNIVDQIKANPDRFFGNWVGGRLPELGGFAWPNPNPVTRYADASFNPGVYEATVGGVKSYVENLGDPALTKWLDPFNANQASNRAIVDRAVYSSTYVKLREVSLTYRLPKKWIQKINVQNTSVSFVATNIYEWTRAGIHIDPERAYRNTGSSWIQGAEYYNMMPWTGSLGFKLNFDF
ncbi:MAG: SusC/RagA family TonB-linked outer membrane protein [Prolixibacteraceae bacterium]|nr:SusC/RagA family TonB-linked outer membrane protein [Prolixibacteraceae bacterium]